MYSLPYDSKNLFSGDQNSYKSHCESESYLSGEIVPNTEYNSDQNAPYSSSNNTIYENSEIIQFPSNPPTQFSLNAYSNGSILKSEETVSQLSQLSQMSQLSQTISTQLHPSYYGGEPLTLYASGGEPVTLYANHAGVVSQGYYSQPSKPLSQITETRKSTKTITLLPPPGMTKMFLQQRTIQSQTNHPQPHQTYQKSMLSNPSVHVKPQTNILRDNNRPSSRLISILPNSGEVQKVKVLPPGQRFYPLDTKSGENFQICLKLDEFGNPAVNLTGSKKKFVQHIHQAVLNFMRDHKIPVRSFCQNVLYNNEEDALAIFLTRSNWDTLSDKEKMMYVRLNDWVKEPVTKRMYDLIQKETDIGRKAEMTNHFVEATTVKKVKKPGNILDFVPHPIKHTEPVTVHNTARDSPSNLFQSEHFEDKTSDPQEEFTEQLAPLQMTSKLDGGTLLSELQANRLHGPPRSRTTLEERNAIRFWSSQHPNPHSEQKKDLARSLGLTKLTVDRLLSYDKRMLKKGTNDDAKMKVVEQFKNHEVASVEVNTRNIPEEHFENRQNYNVVDKQEKSGLYQDSFESGEVGNSSLASCISKNETGNPANLMGKNPSQFIQINSEKLKAVIRNAMKSSGSGKSGFDPKKTFKVVIKPDGSSKYNNLALDSYFKHKPNPTEAQIAYFVQCTKVPYKITKEYLFKRSRNSSVIEVDKTPSYVAAKNNEFQSKLNLVSDRKIPATSSPLQQLNTRNVQPISQFQTQFPASSTLSSQPGQLANLSQDQIIWMENFYQNTTNPDMQTIIDFSKSIDVPFGTVAGFLENMLDSKYQKITQNNQETRAETNLDDVRNIDPEVLDLVRKITKKNFSPNLDKELKSLFGNKIFCTLDDIKSYATANSLNFQDIFRKLNKQESVQLVSEETCKRLLGTDSKTIKAEPIEFDEDKENNFAQNINKFNGEEMVDPHSTASSDETLFENLESKNPDDTILVKTKQEVENTYSSLSISLVPKDTPKIKQEEPGNVENVSGIPTNNWLTSSELLFEENEAKSEMVNNKVVCKTEPVFENETGGDFGVEYETELVEIDIETSTEKEENVNKRKQSEFEQFSTKRQKPFDDNLSYDDSGYTTNDDSTMEGTDTLTSSDVLSNIIMENIGEVNMLDDSLDLFNDSIRGIDLVNDMFQKVENEDSVDTMTDHVKVKVEVEDESEHHEGNIILENAHIDKITCDENTKTSFTKDPSTFSDLRKVFYGPFENFNPHFQVVSIKPGFKSDVFEVELSDGKEFSNNFYFKTGSSALKINLMIKLKQLRYIGARICVESFESLSLENSILGNPDPIEDEFFSNLRSLKLEPRDIFEISAPKTIMEYILLEENIRTFIESFGCNIELFKFSTGEEELKKEILFSLCKSQQRFSSKLLKVLSSHLNMNRPEIELFISTCKPKFTQAAALVYQDHGYCNLYKALA